MSKLACCVLFVVTVTACVVDAPAEVDDPAADDKSLAEDAVQGSAREALELPEAVALPAGTQAAPTKWHQVNPVSTSARACSYCHASQNSAPPASPK